MKFIQYSEEKKFTENLVTAICTTMKFAAKFSPTGKQRIAMGIGEGTAPEIGWGVFIDMAGDPPHGDFMASERSGVTVYGFKDKPAAQAWLEILQQQFDGVYDDEAVFSSWKERLTK
jgi:hypothetical protein